ncbi:Adenylate cyclase 1 [Tritonibacter multivorans]|uniref:Adenylate cyclase 1 n=1 Tax=Tritonibacter multivorans TaxID=928856 RepID=A0A0P1G330_9RHOB|nr:adenylate/guanylate cyclase domain-containing protein [Tritonibacter multivorans]MDA7422844.1 adenylate/guanylate cyclase domain-containing protein [Tritonibacter multivorans]CUH76263.1 Adenylate cyclase 1 [Tritonibacter multivorans]SFD61760.1 adenylate/guanylate cyclase [Tritonibacter multivorans]
MANSIWQGSLKARARIISGLILFVWALFHFLNLGLGLLSPSWMDALQDARQLLQRSLPGSVLLYGALLIHAGLAVWDLSQRRNLRLPPTAWVQTILGLLIPVQLIAHITFTRVADEVLEVNDSYAYEILLMWGNPSIWWQSALLLVVWVHGCIGLHHWLKLTPFWQRCQSVLFAGAVLLPAFSLAGLLTEGRRLVDLAFEDGYWDDMRADFNWPDPEGFAFLAMVSDRGNATYGLLLGAAFVSYALTRWLRLRRSVRITYTEGPQITGERGMTLLEIAQSNGMDHPSLCGGKGRCTTCRVLIPQGGDTLDPPSEAEARALRAAKAPEGSRLACQIRPTAPLTVTRAFAPVSRRRNRNGAGEEKPVAVMFLDIRGFTARSTGLLPYDVVFLLNRFFDAVVPQITAQGGRVDKYLGDGFLALFEAGPADTVAGAALRALEGVGAALEQFNTAMEADGEQPLRIGIGLHLGTVVLGEIGTADHAPRTLIGNTVNAASRLEAETKQLGVELLVSRAVIEAAGIKRPASDYQRHVLRGVKKPVEALALPRAADLSSRLNAE